MISHPEKWVDYLRKCAFAKSAFEQETPWISLEAIESLQETIKPGMSVLEFGGGGSTLFFAKEGLKVTTIESDADWKHNIEQQITAKGLSNVEILLREFEVQPESSFRKSTYMLALPGHSYDVILVDGPEIAGYKARPICFEWAEKNINENGIIIVDDAWRYGHLLTQNNAKSVKEFVSIGPGRKGITKTDIYYY
jgi:predicted O-methyltransferase YrrM